MSIIGARGCPNWCTFCALQTIWGRKARFRSAENVLEEIRCLIKDFGIRDLYIADDTFTASRASLTKFCEIIIRDNIDIIWVCNARINTINEEIPRLMKSAGCHNICHGIELGDESILENICKKISLSKAEEAVRLTKKLALFAGHHLFWVLQKRPKQLWKKH
jgi:radical SAM superfamily enzyme YgiQ (UPF0313 family)